MNKLTLLGAAVAALAIGGSAEAQFRLDYAPSSYKAAPSPAKDKLDDNRLHPLSSLGGRQGTPSSVQPAAPAAPALAYSGVPSFATVPGGATMPAIGIKPGIADPSFEDPNKPRQPLAPNGLKTGVAPR